MGKPGRLRQAITTTAFQHPVNGSLKVNLVTYGNINWLYPELGSQSHPYGLTLIYYFSIATWFDPWHFMPATE